MKEEVQGLLSRDPVTFEVVRSGFYAICEEMKNVIMRTSFSPLLSLSADLSCAILDPRGAVAAQGNDIPVHLGAMPFTAAAVLAAHPAHNWRPGDAVLVNDPYSGGTHLPDMSLMIPVFWNDELIAFSASRMHWPDVGGNAKGSSGISDEIFKEGIRIPPIRIIEAGRVRHDLLELVVANARVPRERRGDFYAQVAGNTRAVNRLREMSQRYGVEVIRTVLRESQLYARLKTEHRLRSLPDCSVSYEEAMDGDGYGSERVAPIVVKVRVEKHQEHILVDFAGSSPATRGPINAPFPVTASVVYYTVMCFLGGDIPPNSGAYGPISVKAPEGSVVNATYPHPVVAGNTETSNRVVDVILGALAKAYPERVPGGSYGCACVYTLGG